MEALTLTSCREPFEGPYLMGACPGAGIHASSARLSAPAIALKVGALHTASCCAWQARAIDMRVAEGATVVAVWQRILANVLAGHVRSCFGSRGACQLATLHAGTPASVFAASSLSCVHLRSATCMWQTKRCRPEVHDHSLAVIATHKVLAAPLGLYVLISTEHLVDATVVVLLCCICWLPCQ